MSHWFHTVQHELQALSHHVTAIPYAKLLLLLIRLTGLLFTLDAFYFIGYGADVTWFAIIGALFVGSLLNAISKTLMLLQPPNTMLRLSEWFLNAIDSFAWTSLLALGVSLYLNYLQLDSFDVYISLGLVYTIGWLAISIVRFVFIRRDCIRLATYYIGLVLLPYRLALAFVKPKYRLIGSSIAVGATLLLAMIILAFQVGDFLTALVEIKGLNLYYLALVVFMLLSGQLVQYLAPKLNFLAALQHPEIVKIIMTWGMIAAMFVFYTFDWKLLMRGVDGWSDAARNNVLWSFTTYRLISGMLEKKFSLVLNDD